VKITCGNVVQVVAMVLLAALMLSNVTVAVVGLAAERSSAEVAATARDSLRPIAIDDDPLVDEIREKACKYYEDLIAQFCSEKMREAERAEATTGRRGAVREAERLCTRCQLTKCWEYQDWVLEDARRQAAKIRQQQRECLDRPLSRGAPARCRRDLDYGSWYDNW
jgi:hypothetical protein